jgi:hypothetical protein
MLCREAFEQGEALRVTRLARAQPLLARLALLLPLLALLALPLLALFARPRALSLSFRSSGSFAPLGVQPSMYCNALARPSSVSGNRSAHAMPLLQTLVKPGTQPHLGRILNVQSCLAARRSSRAL